jgi:RimJ/RimL family protein N-acetyltransferase
MPPHTLNLTHAALTGEAVMLVPLQESHARELWQCTTPGTFEYFPFWPPTWDEAGFLVYVRDALATSNRMAFATIERRGGRVVGSTSFLDIRPAHLGVEIGSSWIAREHRGTRVNPEAKLLMFRHAFEVMGCERVQLKCDARNIQSQRAIAKLGATYEGTLRKHMVMAEGFVRDTVMFSVTRAEWPRVEAMLKARLV